MDPKRYPELLSFLFVGLLVFFMVFPLHEFSGSLPGHLLGIAGTLLMAATLVYVFRKRVLKKKGKANPINPHVYYGLIGGVLVVMHSGSTSASLIGVLVFIGMLLTVLSGIVGRILFVKLNRSIKEKKSDIRLLETSLRQMKQDLNPFFCRKELKLRRIDEWAYEAPEGEPDPQISPALNEKCINFRAMAESLAEREERLQVYTKTKTLFDFWHNIHITFTCFLLAMVIVHVMTTVYYGLRWLP